MDANEAKFLAALLTAACIVTLILIFFIVTIMRYHRRNLALYREKIAVEINTLEKERSRIATDLHDQLGLILSTVKLQASVLVPANGGDEKIITTMKHHIDTMLGDIRTICNNLRPGLLHQQGFYRAITALLNSINDTTAIKIQLSVKGNKRPMPMEREIHVYRILQEILTNVLKHSGATHVTVIIEQHGGKLTLQVQDNGKGFDPKPVFAQQRGLGLQNILNRIELLKGEIDIASKANEGTTYKIQIPIKRTDGKNQSDHCR
jgi:two-component system, NarL family, sensor kinase